MKYVKRLLEETEYLQWVEELEQAEAERIFCRHGLSHSLDVARIGWILTLERGQAGTGKPGEALKEKIYLTALLHDLGRLSEAKQGTPHHRAGAALAEQLLARIQYPKEDRQEILAAISDQVCFSVSNILFPIFMFSSHSNRKFPDFFCPCSNCTVLRRCRKSNFWNDYPLL
mgnify:CR=1 FL=1